MTFRFKVVEHQLFHTEREKGKKLEERELFGDHPRFFVGARRKIGDGNDQSQVGRETGEYSVCSVVFVHSSIDHLVRRGSG